MNKQGAMEQDIRANEILRKNKLSVTGSRKKIIRLFLEQAGALAHGDIEKKAGEKFDRVTIYRTLQTFVDKGIIHTIPTSDNSVRYALCRDACTEGHHHDHHVHFLCLRCGKTYCLDEIVTPEVRLPKEYSIHQVSVVVEGVCKKCN